MSNSESDRDEYGEGTPHVVICQCTGDKRDEAAPAGDIYDESDYFVKQRAYADLFGDYWFIQSAKHGLLEPGEVIEPYDKHAKDIDNPEAWAESIADDLESMVPPDSTVDILGGKDYADPLTPELELRAFEVFEPLRGQKYAIRKKTLEAKVNTTLGGFA